MEFSEAYRLALEPQLETLCEVRITQAQLAGFQKQLAEKGTPLTPEADCPYYDAEGWILKVAYGCVEKQIRKAQAAAREQALHNNE